MKKISVAVAFALLPFSALADGNVVVEDAYARSANPKTGAIFMALQNHGDAACTLIAVSSDVAERVELHTHQEVDGVMKMVEVEGGISLPAGEGHMLKRGSDHVMLMGLHEPLAQGDNVALTLDFADCGEVELDVAVDNERQAEHAAHSDHDDMGHTDHSDH